MSKTMGITTRRRSSPQRLDIARPTRAGLLVVLALFGAAFVTVAQAPVDKSLALAEVRLITAKAHDVRLPAGFGLARLTVTEGQDVAVGDVIAVLDTAVIDAQTVALKAQAAAIQQQLDLVRREAQGFNDLLDQRLMSRTKVTALERQLADLERDAAEIVARIVRAEQQLTQPDIRTPISGRISLVADAGSGQPMAPDAPVARVVPAASRLVVEARLSPGQAQTWRVGQQFSVWLHGYSWLNGRPSSARLAWMAPEVAPGADAGDRFVTARIELDAQPTLISAGLAELPGLRGGLLLRDGQRTLMQQLLDPIRRNFNRSSRA